MPTSGTNQNFKFFDGGVEIDLGLGSDFQNGELYKSIYIAFPCNDSCFTSSHKDFKGKEAARDVNLEVQYFKNGEFLMRSYIPVWIKTNIIMRDLELPSRRP